MEMKKLSMCRICLVENVYMYVVSNKNLQELYEKLTDAPLVTEDRRPMLACYFCCAKLKQCWQLQRKCLEAEELFAQMLKENYETKPQLNQDELEFGGYVISPTEHINIFDECQTENDNIKKELPDVCEGQAVENQTESKHEFQNIEIVNIQPHHSEDILAQHCESEDEALLMDFKTEEKEDISTHLSESEAIPAQYSESDADVPLVNLRTKVGGEQEVSKKKRKANKTKNATAAKKPKLDMRGPNPEDSITSQQKKTEDQYSTNIKPSIILKKYLRLCKKKPYKCDICLRSFTEKSSLTKHTRVHISENLYTCEICQSSFSAKDQLTSHIRVHTGEKPYKCNICRRSFSQKGSLKIHTRVHNGEKPFECNICQRRYIRKAALTTHIRVHTGGKPFKCNICQRSFSYKEALTRHTRVHTGEKPYECDICQRSFTQTGDLTKHIRVHTGEKPYKCNICQRCFTRNGDLRKHIRVHTGEKPYKCDICQRSFAVKSYLTMHVGVHMGEKKFKCDLCQRSFSRAETLKRHMRIHTREKLVECV